VLFNFLLEVQGRHDSQMWVRPHSSQPRPHAEHDDARPRAICHYRQHARSLPHTSSTRLLQARCRKSKRESPCARSAGTRARRTRRRPSARRDRSVRPCPLESQLPHYQAPDALRPTPTGPGPGPDRKHHNPSRGRRGPIRRPTWSRGGTLRRSRRCRATSEMEHPCRKCHSCPPSTATRVRRESKDRLEARMGVR
jgi:hypothetical protein